MVRSPSVKRHPVFLLSLGCAKNLTDSERLAARLEAWGYELVESVEEARTAIVNTCGFIRPATEESIRAILDLEGLKAEGRLETIGVVGCLLNRYGETSKRNFLRGFLGGGGNWEALGRRLGSGAPLARMGGPDSRRCKMEPLPEDRRRMQ